MLFNFRGSSNRKKYCCLLSVEKTLTDKLTGFEKSDINKPLDTVPPAEEFDLQAETLELKEKIDRITKKTTGIDALNVSKGN